MFSLDDKTFLFLILACGWFTLAVFYISVSVINSDISKMDPAMMPSMGPMKMGCLDTSMGGDISMACMMVGSEKIQLHFINMSIYSLHLN